MTVRLIIIMLCAIVNSGCSGAALLTAASTATFIHTDKTPVDLVASRATGEDCSILAASQGENYCREQVDENAMIRRKLEQSPYCYHSLGEITCYDTPDPYNNNEVPVR